MDAFAHRNDFNPRSREGSDNVPGIMSVADKHFNPRSREGSDKRADGKCMMSNISIHAPAKGATSEY